MTKIISLEDCLFDAFANSDIRNSHEDRYMWAIWEGLRRIDLYAPPWRRVKARKVHKCVRTCTIAVGSIYFIERWADMSDYQAVPKYCVSCLAMILYFKEVHHLPPQFYTHWDLETKEPVKI